MQLIQGDCLEVMKTLANAKRGYGFVRFALWYDTEQMGFLPSAPTALEAIPPHRQIKRGPHLHGTDPV